MNLPANAVSEETGQLPRYFWLLGLILAVAALLRSCHLSSESLWIDEMSALNTASGPFQRALTQWHGVYPLYHVGLHFWIKLFGTSEAGLRSFSVVPSVIAVALTYLLGARIYDRRTALVATSFMAVSSFQIEYAQEARMYALVLALLVGSMLVMDIILRGERGKKQVGAWVAYVLLTAAALHTHPYAMFFVAGENLFFLLRWRQTRPKLRAWVAGQLVTLVLFAPTLANIIRLQSAGYTINRRYMLLKLPQAFFSLLAGDTLIPLDEAAVHNIRATLLANWHWLALSVVGFGLVFAAALAAVKRHRRASWFALAMVLAPALVSYAFALKSGHFDERYLIGIMPVLYLFLASGVTTAFSTDSRRPLRVLAALGSALVVVITLASLGQYYFHPRFGKEQWREVARYVDDRAVATDLVVFDSGYVGDNFNYYSRRHPYAELPLADAAFRRGSPQWNAAMAELAARRRIWLVRAHSFSDNVFDHLQSQLAIRDHVSFPKAKGIDIYLMEK